MDGVGSIYRRFGKRFCDLLLASLLLVLSAPVMALVALLIHWRMRSPVLFRQVRPGLHGRPFALVKFRAMTNERDALGVLLPDDQRLTRLGRALRRLSLDELPQLWNVVRGEMSLVGPRPLLCEYLPRYTPEQMRRHDVLPGITGWAQVNGRQDIPFSRRLILDVWYVDHLSFLLDLKIAGLSIVRAAQGSGVRSGQDVLTVDDLGLHDATRAMRAQIGKESFHDDRAVRRAA